MIYMMITMTIMTKKKMVSKRGLERLEFYAIQIFICFIMSIVKKIEFNAIKLHILKNLLKSYV